MEHISESLSLASVPYSASVDLLIVRALFVGEFGYRHYAGNHHVLHSASLYRDGQKESHVGIHSRHVTTTSVELHIYIIINHFSSDEKFHPSVFSGLIYVKPR